MTMPRRLRHALRARGADVRSVDPRRWGLGGLPGLLRAVRQEAPNVILMQIRLMLSVAGSAMLAWSLLQRCAPLVVTLHEFTGAHPLRRLAVGAAGSRPHGGRHGRARRRTA